MKNRFIIFCIVISMGNVLIAMDKDLKKTLSINLSENLLDKPLVFYDIPSTDRPTDRLIKKNHFYEIDLKQPFNEDDKNFFFFADSLRYGNSEAAKFTQGHDQAQKIKMMYKYYIGPLVGNVPLVEMDEESQQKESSWLKERSKSVRLDCSRKASIGESFCFARRNVNVKIVNKKDLAIGGTILSGHIGNIIDIALLRDGRIASVSDFGEVFLWDYHQKICERMHSVHNYVSIVFQLKNGDLGVVADKQYIEIWNLNKQECLQEYDTGEPILDVAQLEDGNFLVVQSETLKKLIVYPQEIIDIFTIDKSRGRNIENIQKAALLMQLERHRRKGERILLHDDWLIIFELLPEEYKHMFGNILKNFESSDFEERISSKGCCVLT